MEALQTFPFNFLDYSDNFNNEKVLSLQPLNQDYGKETEYN